jgi:hypothetical protein
MVDAGVTSGRSYPIACNQARRTEAVRAYVEAHEEVVHLEKAASELVGPVRHDIWDVHCTDGRWWVFTEPTNLYSRDAFRNRDEALGFRVGLSTYCLVPGEIGLRYPGTRCAE